MTESPHPDPLHRTEDQDAVFALLADPATHGIDEPVVRIDTHGAVVFLAGRDAYKVKRAVKFPFMDYGTAERRRVACEAEVAINRPHAPGLYLGVVPITRTGGGVALGGGGTPVEHAVHMRRFDETMTLDRVAGRGELTDAMLEALVRAVLASHAAAPVRDGRPATDDLALYVTQNREAFAENASIFPAADAARLVERQAMAWTRAEALLVARGTRGFVRRCHGDLHLRNVVLLDGRPVLFDAIEFSDPIATGDVLYDLAFLIMDLWERGYPKAASLVLNRYLRAGGPEMTEGLAAMPLFLSLRASIRAKVTAAGVGALPPARRPAAVDDARRYFGLAAAALDRPAPRLVAVGGRSGTGKTTLAAALAPRIGAIPGAVHLSSDVTRKRLAGVPETERLPPSTYTRAASADVYAALRADAAAVVATGMPVIVDAVHLDASERAAIRSVAEAAGARFTGLWLEAPVAVLADRVGQRRGGPSDATAEVVRMQAEVDTGRLDWTTIDASDGLDPMVEAAVRAIDGDP
jgi:aminoglycoside phosphotransferase family enzyme/predicted kinase